MSLINDQQMMIEYLKQADPDYWFLERDCMLYMIEHRYYDLALHPFMDQICVTDEQVVSVLPSLDDQMTAWRMQTSQDRLYFDVDFETMGATPLTNREILELTTETI